MADSINRDAVIALIEDRQRALCPRGRFSRSAVYGSDRDAFDAWQELIDAIKALPTDIAVVHGYWIPVDEKEDAFDCSECDAMVQKRYNFCPKCGAMMDL